MVTNTPTWPGWETVRIIGRGSFGAVYEIQRDVFGEIEKAALKVITIPQNASDIEEMYSDGYDDESITSTFKNHLKSIIAEYSLMRKMNGCVNIVNCDDVRYVQHDDGIGWDIFIKMELLTPLTKAIDANPDEETVIKLAKDMCRALEICDQYGIVHRDIKPQNMFVSSFGDYKLGDFGIAKTVEKTMGGTKIGTYKYMAPEVYNNQPYGKRADIYSLGLTLYWLLNERRMPFMPLPPLKLASSMEEESRCRRFSGERIPAPARGSEELKRIVLKACAYDAAERYSSAAEMLRDLTILSGEYVGEDGEEGTIGLWGMRKEKMVPESRMPEPEPPKAELQPEPEPVQEPVYHPETGQRPASDNKNMWIIPIVIGCVALAVILGFVLGRSGKETVEKENVNNPNSILQITPAPGATHPTEPEPEVAETSAPSLTPAETPAPMPTPEPSPTLVDLGILEIEAGYQHTAVLNEDGTVVCVGNDAYGQCSTEYWSDIVDLSVSFNHTVGARSNGSVVAVGTNDYGQCNVQNWRGVKAVAAGGFHTVGLLADGTVVAIGRNHLGQCEVDSWTNIASVYAGYINTVGLRTDGTVVAVGYNDFGQCQTYNWTDVIDISVSDSHVLALRSDGTVYAAGKNNHGQCDVSGIDKVVDIGAGCGFSSFLLEDGTVLTIGINDVGQSDSNDWENIQVLCSGTEHIIGIKNDGSVVCAGANNYGQCDINSLIG